MGWCPRWRRLARRQAGAGRPRPDAAIVSATTAVAGDGVAGGRNGAKPSQSSALVLMTPVACLVAASLGLASAPSTRLEAERLRAEPRERAYVRAFMERLLHSAPCRPRPGDVRGAMLAPCASSPGRQHASGSAWMNRS